MANLSNELWKVIESLDGDTAKIFSIARNNAKYTKAVKAIWQAPKASRLILEHTNAFYIREDTSPRKGGNKEEPYMICEVCADDPTVRSELDTHRELLQLHLKQNGLNFEELRIIPARRGMKERHPFSGK